SPAGPGDVPPAMSAPREGGAPGDALPDPESPEAAETGAGAWLPSDAARAAGLVLAAGAGGAWLDSSRSARRARAPPPPPRRSSRAGRGRLTEEVTCGHDG